MAYKIEFHLDDDVGIKMKTFRFFFREFDKEKIISVLNRIEENLFAYPNKERHFEDFKRTIKKAKKILTLTKRTHFQLGGNMELSLEYYHIPKEGEYE